MFSEVEIVAGLRTVGLGTTSVVMVHASLSSFGPVDGGALTVCRALVAVCGTILVPAGSWDRTGVPAPPGLVRQDNACRNAASWEEFDAALARAAAYCEDLPIDAELGRIPEAMRSHFPHSRSRHPLVSFLAVGSRAEEFTDASRLDWPLGPLDALAATGGDVLLLGVGHDTNTLIHLAEQRLDRSSFYRYAKCAEGVWMELPNIPGQCDGFGAIERHLQSATVECFIGKCRARRVPARTVLETARRLILADPAALLCADPECSRCRAAHRQRLAVIETEASAQQSSTRE